MQKSPIEWTDYTTNPFRARHKVTKKLGWQCVVHGPGCTNCYSAKSNLRFGTKTQFTEGGAADIELFVNEKEFWAIIGSKKCGRVFPFDMTDAMWKAYPDEWLDRFFAVVAICQNFTFQLLTKRAKRLPEYFRPEAANRWARIVRDEFLPKLSPCLGHLVSQLENGDLWPLPNLWLGVSCEDQTRANERVPNLLYTPAAVRFVSAEPLIGHIDLTEIPYASVGGAIHRINAFIGYGGWLEQRWEHALDWVIVGGESGNTRDIRECELDWIRSIVRQCKAAEVPVFVKQLGRLPVIERTVFDPPKSARNSVVTQEIKVLSLKNKKGGDPSEWPEDLRVREFPRAAEVASR